MNLLAHAKAHRLDAQLQRLQAFEELIREQRQLLRPGRRSHVDGEHPAAQPARLGATRHAIAHQAAPGIAIDRHPAALGRNHARPVEQLPEHLRTGVALHQPSGTSGRERVKRRRDDARAAVLRPLLCVAIPGSWRR